MLVGVLIQHIAPQNSGLPAMRLKLIFVAAGVSDSLIFGAELSFSVIANFHLPSSSRS